MYIDRFTRFILSVIAVSLFIIAMNMTFPTSRVNAQANMEGKTFTFPILPKLEEFCLEMEEMRLEMEREVPKLTFPEMEITWPEIEKLCGME